MCKRIKNSLNNNRGAAILWAVLMSIILLTFVFLIIVITTSQHKITVNNSDRNQAYFTARSTAEAIATSIKNGNSQIVPKNINGTIRIDKIDLPSEMGSAYATITRIREDMLRVKAYGSFGKQKQSVNALLKTRKIEGQVIGTGLYTSSIKQTNGSLNIQGDLFIDPNSQGGSPRELKIQEIKGNIYSLSNIDFSSESFINGDIYCNGKVTLPNGIKTNGNIYSDSLKVENNANISENSVAYARSMDDKNKKFIHQPFDGIKSLIQEAQWPNIDFQDKSVEVIETLADNFDNLPKEQPSLPGVEIPTGFNIDSSNSSKYYSIKKSIYNDFYIDNIEIQGSNPIYISVEDGIRVSINQISNSSNAKVFFILDGGSSLILPDSQEEFEFSIYGSRDSHVLVGNCTLKGVIFTGDLDISGNFTLIANREGNNSDISSVIDGWVIIKYERGDS